MAFDSAVMTAIVAELHQQLTGGRISKIYQPKESELTLLIYSGGKNYRLLLSADPRFARIHLTAAEKRNPAAPPTFCMLMRKYIDGGRILSIGQPDRERICQMQIGVIDELGNPVEYRLIAEVMGKRSNILLLNPQGRIVDAIRRVTEEVNRYRELLPGLPYVAPPPVQKLDPATVTPAALAPLGSAAPLWQVLLDAVDGLSPLLAREVAFRAGVEPEAPSRTAPWERIASALQALTIGVGSDGEPWQPTLLYDRQGRLKEFHAIAMTHWPGEIQTGFASVNACADAYYDRREQAEQVSALCGSLTKLVRDEIGRIRRKLALQQEALQKVENAETLRIQGELITANLWQIKKGATEARLVNYYEPDGGELLIPLDGALEPAENAQAYYRRYQKARSGRGAIEEQLAKSRAELAYLEQVEVALQEAASLPDLEEVHRELQAEGYLRESRRPKATGRRTAPRQQTAREERVSPPLTVRSTDGLEIWIGRNNRQNDYLTLKLAAPHDLWFHTKEIPGSHVILRVGPGRELPERAIHEAAALAAYYSKGRDSASVPVDYTLRKHVRKPTGARPGMVIYEHQKTLWVTPDPALNPILQAHMGDRHDS